MQPIRVLKRSAARETVPATRLLRGWKAAPYRFRPAIGFHELLGICSRPLWTIKPRVLFHSMPDLWQCRHPLPGNENNEHQPDGRIFLGPGKSPGYGVANLGARYRIRKQLEVIGQLDNVFNHRYFTSALLGSTGLTATGNFIARPFAAVGGEFPVQQVTFYAPGAPRSLFVTLRFRF